jgi:hypothetical protein
MFLVAGAPEHPGGPYPRQNRQNIDVPDKDQVIDRGGIGDD